MSYEADVKRRIKEGNKVDGKLDFSIVKYFWQSNPLSYRKSQTIPKFLRKIFVLKNFTDIELRRLANAMHFRTFSDGDVIFDQNDKGMGFYFIFTGMVDIIVESDIGRDLSKKEKPSADYILSLEKFDYFGELALLQEDSIRNATVIARERCELLGIFKPDLENLIHEHPIVATKLLQSVSLIISNRLFSITNEVRELKYKLAQMETSNAKDDK